MRYLFGFMCVVALGVIPLVGCSETGGGVVSSCVDVENFTPCKVGDTTGLCYETDCLPTDCSNLDDGAGCVPEPDRCCGVCEDGNCTDRVSDCTGFVDLTQCAFVGNDGFCIEDECVPTDCENLEDGTECLFLNPLGGFPGFCEAGECSNPEQ